MTIHSKCAVSAQVDAIHAIASGLSDREKLEVIRALNEDLTYSWGSDMVAKGCDYIADDIADEQAVVERGLEAIRPITTQIRPLNPDIWGAL